MGRITHGWDIATRITLGRGEKGHTDVYATFLLKYSSVLMPFPHHSSNAFKLKKVKPFYNIISLTGPNTRVVTKWDGS